MIKKMYTVSDIDKLITRYQKLKNQIKKQESMHELLGAFEGFIIKYTNFLKCGEMVKKDKDLMGLVKMFDSNNKTSAPIDIIRNILINYTYDDVLAELQLIFIKCVNKYTKHEGGPPFTGFLYAYYKFMIRNWLKKLAKDALNTKYLVSIDETEYAMNVYFSEQIKVFDHICMTDATDLTNLEKYILFLSYDRKLRDDEIGRIVGLSRVHINNVKNKSKEKLRYSGHDVDDFRIA